MSEKKERHDWLREAAEDSLRRGADKLAARDLIAAYEHFGARDLVKLLEEIIEADRMYINVVDGEISRTKLEHKAAQVHLTSIKNDYDMNGPGAA